MEGPLYLVHYDELGTKGRNRPEFEQLLQNAIHFALWGMPKHIVKRLPGRVVVRFSRGISADETIEISRRLARVPGIANFSPAFAVSTDLKAIEARMLVELEGRSFESFRVTVRRSDKKLPCTSDEVARRLGSGVVERFGKRVDLRNPELTIHVELLRGESYLYFDRIRGVGGLPMDRRNRVVVMLSGGIDSPVAAFRMMKRGCQPVFAHFHSAPYTSELSIHKVKNLAGLLCAHRCRARLFLVPIAPIQRRMVTQCHPMFRVLLYRRLMYRVAERIAEGEGALGIVTGESLGQVASQTLRNQMAIEAAVSLPVLRPLIGMDKQEIIAQAQSIGTYDVSIEPHGDCCSYLQPADPATHAGVEELDQQEVGMPMEEWVEEAMASAERILVNGRAGALPGR